LNFDETVNNLAYEFDKIFHGGKVSGVDNNIIAYGGALIFNRSTNPKIKKFCISHLPYDILLIDSGV